MLRITFFSHLPQENEHIKSHWSLVEVGGLYVYLLIEFYETHPLNKAARSRILHQFSPIIRFMLSNLVGLGENLADILGTQFTSWWQSFQVFL